MPRKPLRSKKRQTTNLTEFQIIELILYQGFSGPQFKTERTRRQAWETNKNFILDLQGQKIKNFPLSKIYFDYFERPAAFYQYDMNEIGTGNPDQRTLCFEDRGCMFFAGRTWPLGSSIVYENQKEYLIKKNLLNDAEKKILRNADNA